MWSARWLPAHDVRIGVARDVSYRRRAELRNDAGRAILEATQAALDLPDLCARIHRILEPLAPVALFAVVTACGADAAQVIYADGDLAAAESSCRWYLEHGQADRSIPATALPFPEQNRVRGMLFVRPPSPHVYSAEQLDLLRLVATFAALALERVQLHLDLVYAAQYDELTGLPNRRLFQDRLATALNRCRRSDIHLGLLFVDVDNFKAVNDTYGHAVGDALLQEIARRLAQCARASDTVARLSGDEFVLIIEELTTPGDAQVVAHKITQAMRLPMDLGGTTLEVGLSLGLAVYPSDTQDADELLSLADAAMYAAKLAKKLKVPLLTV
jgi:diguanylate cyclase (GGDEF)-like protein